MTAREAKVTEAVERLIGRKLDKPATYSISGYKGPGWYADLPGLGTVHLGTKADKIVSSIIPGGLLWAMAAEYRSGGARK